MVREHEEKVEVRTHLGDDLHGLQNGKLEGLVLLTQFCKEDGRHCIKGKDSSHILDTGSISVIAQSRSYRVRKGQHQCQECRSDTEYRNKGTGIDLPRIDSLLVCKTETSRFQTKHKHNLKYGDVCHELGYYAVLSRIKDTGIYRNKKEVDDAGQDGA